MTHYDALGVPRDAGAGEIRRAYLDAARRHHPDYFGDATPDVQADHARRMQAVTEAWAVLGDPARRTGYDLTLRRPVEPPTERIRPNREPATPAGKGWTPRRGDDKWQRDFTGWAAEDDRLPEDAAGPGKRALLTLPVGLFAVAVLLAFVGVVLTARPLLAGAFVAFVASVALFVFLPMFEMTRGRRRR